LICIADGDLCRDQQHESRRLTVRSIISSPQAEMVTLLHDLPEAIEQHGRGSPKRLRHLWPYRR